MFHAANRLVPSLSHLAAWFRHTILPSTSPLPCAARSWALQPTACLAGFLEHQTQLQPMLFQVRGVSLRLAGYLFMAFENCGDNLGLHVRGPAPVRYFGVSLAIFGTPIGTHQVTRFRPLCPLSPLVPQRLPGLAKSRASSDKLLANTLFDRSELQRTNFWTPPRALASAS